MEAGSLRERQTALERGRRVGNAVNTHARRHCNRHVSWINFDTALLLARVISLTDS